ncbi:NUDIX domain-containing protein [Paenibacillus alginolyticus]|uniref:NUDIX domain-containing protein n=1 Tax=Paenibacillus alginolyticus TaxID=59839 RepID=UPI00041FC5B1|nr:NUDIX domain-containing protein [Paenibacillus alginolyticus]MCY9668236.1 NUDIX domain-containing protein [Paenibacillus alginolyticus]
MIQRNVLGKVTCFITREKDAKIELLLIQHPNAGIQFPAGTVEMNEDFKQSALREAFEETGLNEFLTCIHIGKQEINLSDDKYVIYQNARVYSRPELSSFNWAEIRRGTAVQHERKHGEFIQISYIEGDKYPEPSYTTYQITGWVEETDLASTVERHFYHLHTECNLNQWTQEADNHLFKLFWSPLDKLPEIMSPQYEWLKYVTSDLNYLFI